MNIQYNNTMPFHSNPHNNVDIRAGQLVEFELKLNVNCNYITHMLGEAFPDDEQLHHRIRVMEHLPNQPLEHFWDEFNSELPRYQGFMYDFEESIITFANGDTEGEIKKVFDCSFDCIIENLFEEKLQSANAIIFAEKIAEIEATPIICGDCDRDFTEECDDRSSFEEVEKVQCMDCHNTEDEVSEKQEDEIVEQFMINENDRDERLKAHYRQGKVIDGKWVNDKEE